MTWHGGYGQQQVSKPGRGGLLDRLGDRADQRAQPRFGIALAGVGTLMIVVGILTWAGERLGNVSDTRGADPDRTLGILLSLIVIAAGYALLLGFKRGPLATAGVVASALGVPVLLGFATFDATPAISDEEFQPVLTLPFNLDAIVLVSLAAWIINYTVVPVARGRAFYLAASTFLLWLYVLEKVEEGAAFYILTLPFSAFLFPLFAAFGAEETEFPDPSTIGGLSLGLGLTYYLIAWGLDRHDRRGVATPFTVAGLVTTVIGLAHLAGDLEAAGTGIFLILVGTPLAIYGAWCGRRFTTWAWAGGIGLGVLLIVGEAFEETAAGFGVAAIVLGSGVVVLAHVLTRWLSEPDEMDPGPSTFTPRPPRPPAAAFAGYPQHYGQPPPGQPWQQPVPPTRPAPPAPQPPPPTPPAPPPPAPTPPGDGPPSYPTSPPT